MTRLILVGADPNSKERTHPGGQLTASIGLQRYAGEQGYDIEILDTTQTSLPPPSLGKRLKRGLGRVTTLAHRLVTSPPDGVIIFAGAGFSFYERTLMARMCRMRGVPNILCIRDGHFATQVAQSSGWRLRLLRRLLQWPSAYAAQGAKWKDLLLKQGVPDDRIRIVRNWLSEEFPVLPPRAAPEGRSIRFFFAGWLVPEKGVPQLMEAVRDLSRTHQFEVRLAGNGPLLEEVRAQAQTLPEGVTVTALGWLEPTDIRNQMQDADVFILPSAAEGFPNALLEAMAMAMPAIVTDVGAVSDALVTGETGVLLPDNTAASIADAMRVYLDDPGQLTRDSVGTHNRFLQLFDREANCRALITHLFNSMSPKRAI